MMFNLFWKKKSGKNENGSKKIGKSVMSKICFPHYSGGDYPNLDSAVRALQSESYGNLKYCLKYIVECNVRYRDFLRQHGSEALMERLIEEAPTLKDSPKDVEWLCNWLDNELGPIAGYDIQCYNIKDTFEVFGKEIHGLAQLRECTEMYCSDYSKSDPWRPERACNKISGLHIGHMYESYPKFDSSDWSDDRTYQNYIIRTRPITKGEMLALRSIKSEGNSKRVHEAIPEDMLPLLYYNGDGNYMLLAKKK